jgi:hypothetical protein
VEKAAVKLAALVGSARVSWTCVASARDVVTSSYSTLSFGAANRLSSSLNRRVTRVIDVMVTFDRSTPKPEAIEPATLATNVVSAARAAAVTFSGKVMSKVSADFTV